MAYYLAVDAGGSKTEFLLAEEDRELGRALTGTIKRVNADADIAARNLHDALAELERTTGVPMASVSRTCVGTSGNTVPLVTDWLREGFTKHVAGPLLLVGDVEIALDAGFFGGRGVLALAGTGSNVAARAADGVIITAGGWGPILADQGAGHWIGIEGLRRGFLSRDEGRPTGCWKPRASSGTCPRSTPSSSSPTLNFPSDTVQNSRAKWSPAPIAAIRWHRKSSSREAVTLLTWCGFSSNACASSRATHSRFLPSRLPAASLPTSSACAPPSSMPCACATPISAFSRSPSIRCAELYGARCKARDQPTTVIVWSLDGNRRSVTHLRAFFWRKVGNHRTRTPQCLQLPQFGNTDGRSECGTTIARPATEKQIDRSPVDTELRDTKKPAVGGLCLIQFCDLRLD